VFSADYPPEELLNIIQKLGVISNLKAIGFIKENAKEAAEQISLIKFSNPAKVTATGVQKLLEDAWAGVLA